MNKSDGVQNHIKRLRNSVMGFRTSQTNTRSSLKTGLNLEPTFLQDYKSNDEN